MFTGHLSKKRDKAIDARSASPHEAPQECNAGSLDRRKLAAYNSQAFAHEKMRGEA